MATSSEEKKGDVASTDEPEAKPDTDEQAAIAPDEKSDSGSPTESVPIMSKNQQKKLKKRQRWLEVRSAKRKQEKAKRKIKKREAKNRGDDLGPSRQKLKRNTMATSSCDLCAVIDCSFDHLMSEKDVNHMVQQIQFSYSANRRAEDPMQLYVTSVGGKCHTRLDSIGDYRNWDVHFKTQSFEELFDKSKIVYLSSDSDNVLETLEDDKVYVIGGLVDHNHHKGLCHSLAVEKGFTHAQLPIASYLDMKTRKVLTVNQVFEILLRYTETDNWEEAFFMTIPKRKGAVAKPGDNKQDQVETESNQLETAELETSETSEKPAGKSMENVLTSDDDSKDSDLKSEECTALQGTVAPSGSYDNISQSAEQSAKCDNGDTNAGPVCDVKLQEER